MASRIEHLAVSVPAGTAIATPQITPFPFREGIVQKIEPLVPPGPSGLVGWAILYDSQQIIPFTSGVYFIMDDDKRSWDVEGYPTASRYKIKAYNTDVYAHLLQFTFLMTELAAPQPPATRLVPIE